MGPHVPLAAAGGSLCYLYSWSDFSLERTWACPSPYAVIQGVDPFTFVLDITRPVAAGPNTVSFTHNEILAEMDHCLVLRNVHLQTGTPIPWRAGTAMEVGLSGGSAIRFKVGQRGFTALTRTGEPGGG